MTLVLLRSSALVVALSAASALASSDGLSERIAGASPGDTIRIEAGSFEGRLVIDKSLVLVGAGWDSTRIEVSQGTGEEAGRPTLTVRGDVKVELRDLRIGGSPPVEEEKGGGLAVRVENGAQLIAHGIAVVGPMEAGVIVDDGATLRMARSLVAAVWGTGIRVDTGGTLVLEESVVRTCYHRCVTLGGAATRSELRRNLISGSAWHGIRYDGARPLIEGNLIYGNARSGIYASGKNSGEVRGNLFWRNEMNGMSCWFDGADTIEANAFVRDQRESLAVISGSAPRVKDNVFLTDTLAVSCGRSSSSNRYGDPLLEGNVLAGKGDAKRSILPVAIKQCDGIVRLEEAPRSFSWNGADVALTDAALEAIVRQGPFGALLPEEVNIAPEGVGRSFRNWNKSGRPRVELVDAGDPDALQRAMRQAYRDSKGWIDDAMSLGDDGRREAAIEAMRAAILSDDVGAIRSGLVALQRTQEVRYERASLAPRALELTRHGDPAIRSISTGAIEITCEGEVAAKRLVEMAREDQLPVRSAAVGSLVRVQKGDLTERGSPEVLALLDASIPHDIRRSTLNILWGASISPELEARLIELSRDRRLGYDTMYYALSTQGNKSRACVERLIELLADADTTNVAGRSAWGLLQGVSSSEHSLVATAGLQLVKARGRGRMLDKGLDLVEAYATAAEVAAIQELLDGTPVLEETSARLRSVVERLSQK